MSLTSQVRKAFESIHENIVNLVNRYSLLLQSQHGFTKGKSCLTNLLIFMEDITRANDLGKPMDVIYLKFIKHLIRFHIKDYYTKLDVMVLLEM